MVTATLPAPADDAIAAGPPPRVLGHEAFARLVGGFRGSNPAECNAHAQRLAHSPVPYRGYAVIDPDGVAVACGQAAAEGDLVGLYDVYTVPSARGQGLAAALCGILIDDARERGARVAYLQVDAANEAARRIYRRLDFADAYSYHYRTPPRTAFPGTAEATVVAR